MSQLWARRGSVSGCPRSLFCEKETHLAGRQRELDLGSGISVHGDQRDSAIGTGSVSEVHLGVDVIARNKLRSAGRSSINIVEGDCTSVADVADDRDCAVHGSAIFLACDRSGGRRTL